MYAFVTKRCLLNVDVFAPSRVPMYLAVSWGLFGVFGHFFWMLLTWPLNIVNIVVIIATTNILYFICVEFSIFPVVFTKSARTVDWQWVILSVSVSIFHYYFLSLFFY